MLRSWCASWSTGSKSPPIMGFSRWSHDVSRSQERFDMVAFWKDVATKVIDSKHIIFLITHHFQGSASLACIMDEVLAASQA